MALDPSEDPAQIKKGWVSTFYSEPPDLVLNEDTDFPAAMPTSLGALQADTVPVEPDPATDGWRQNVKAWFDSLP